MAPFNELIWFVPVAVFFAGIIGSPHCLSMCGPIVISFSNQRLHLISYQLGRMVAYTAAGALVGGMGSIFLGGPHAIWISNITVALIAILLFINGYRALTGKSLHWPTPKIVNRFSNYLWKKLRLSALPKTTVAGLTGILTVFLPCGHLYSFLIGAAATGSAVRGSAFMFAFWLGSAPLLSASGTIIQKVLKPKLANGQRWAGIILVMAGLMSALAFSMRSESFSKSTQSGQHQHSANSCH